LRLRLPEIVQAIYAHIQEAVTDPVGGQDPTYQNGVLAAVAAVLDYCLEAIEHGPGWSGPIPPEAADQARRAARSGVSLGTVIRRYVAAHSRLGDFVAEEAEHIGLSGNGTALQHLRRTQEALLERLTATIAQEYDDEGEHMARQPAERRTEIVRRLLAEEPVDPVDLADLGYELDASWHLGVIATGAGIRDDLRRLKANLGCEVLPVPCDGDTTCAWLGASRKLNLVEAERLLAVNQAATFALGGLGKGLDGWRQTHLEARGALLRARHQPEKVVRYADEPLLSAVLENDTLATWLREFLRPLRDRPDGAELLHTLRAYIDTECNRSSAAAVLNVRRQTVGSRLHVAEDLLGRPLRTCLAELDTALHLTDLTPDNSSFISN
jgi:DNA-binding PucR family transcriptional regulator